MTKDEAMKLAVEALEDMNCGWKYIREVHGDLYGVGWDRAQGKADDAITALRQAMKLAESKSASDCDSPSWCNQYGRCHRSVIGAPMLANCIQGQKPVAFLMDGELFTIAEYEVIAEQGDGAQPLYKAPKAEEQEPVACECHRCIKEKDLRDGAFPLNSTKMILCPECGNKRCPKASDHRLACTGSNESGQVGSIYTAPPKREWQGLTDEETLALVAYSHPLMSKLSVARAIEAKLKEKNT